MDNTLELLKSLTQGVNNKVSQEQKSYEYIVNTSLKNKNKKSTPPIVKEVIKDKKEEKKEVEESEIFYDFIDTDEVVDEIIGDISENFDETSADAMAKAEKYESTFRFLYGKTPDGSDIIIKHNNNNLL